MRHTPCTTAPRRLAGFGALLLGGIGLLSASQSWALTITSATWNDSRNRLEVSGDGAGSRATVSVFDADTAQLLDSGRANGQGSWSIRERLSSPPCRVRAESGSESAEADVSPAPSNCSGGGNTPPTADAGGPYSGTAGEPVAFDGSDSSDSDGTIEIYEWDFDASDGIQVDATGPTPSHNYANAGTYTVTLTVTDDGGESHSATADATIAEAPPPPVNEPPVADAGGPYTGTAGSPVTFDGSGSSDSDGTIETYEWDFDVTDGIQVDATGPTPSHNYADGGTYTVTLTVTDDGGESDSATATATIDDAPPVDLPGPVGQEQNTGLLGRDHPGFVVLGANDLGMHCADQDDSIFSVLPPFNVLHAQVIQRGSTPVILDDTDVEVTYSAASNPNDPVGPGSINSTSANFPVGALAGLQVYKGNFWDVNPSTGNPQGFDTYEPLFFGLLSPEAVIMDLGLPAPETTLLTDCLPSPLGAVVGGDGSDCNFEQQAMPGFNDPYYVNDPEPMHFDRDTGFFNDLLGSPNSIPGVVGQPLGGVITNVNWFRADGIPILPVDDSGRDNAYPLVRVMAKQNGQAVASTDVVLPVAAEADCQLCHADPIDCANPDLPQEIQTDQCNGIAVSPAAVSGAEFDVATIDTAPGGTVEQRLLNAAKINILRLHDAKHSTTLDETRNVVCASCHYSPALDLAQVGPQGAQAGNISMSRAMHGHHGDLMVDGALVFPDMPPPDQRLPGEQQDVLEQTCYQCHPGKRTQCLRGAMGGAGIVCQDCHGNMTQVGNDFTGGGPRVSWASEPKCQSCHTGDAVNKNHPADAIVAPDGIRLLQAYIRDEHIDAGGDALPILSPDSPFAENETLYRLSGNDDGSGKGHGGVMCEGCHGSTHAIWPNANPNANDNVAANQLQGHSGTIVECSTCHNPSAFEDSGPYEFTMNGPHGMHAVGSRLWNKSHKAARQNGGDNCRACHGQNGEGTVLSRMAKDRILECKDNNGSVCSDEGPQLFEKGHEVGCGDCHRNAL